MSRYLANASDGPSRHQIHGHVIVPEQDPGAGWVSASPMTILITTCQVSLPGVPYAGQTAAIASVAENRSWLRYKAGELGRACDHSHTGDQSVAIEVDAQQEPWRTASTRRRKFEQGSWKCVDRADRDMRSAGSR
jgi:hypothetical protein